MQFVRLLKVAIASEAPFDLVVIDISQFDRRKAATRHVDRAFKVDGHKRLAISVSKGICFMMLIDLHCES
jgi:hypothetical protein